jgi:putative heme-binding domain-containing protein
MVFQQACATCHRVGNVGTDVGPNLATISHRTPEDLLVHILDPNREVASNYLNYTLSLDDGRVVTGMIVDESANAITLRRAEGAGEVVARDRIDQIRSSGQSLMPEGLEKGLSSSDFADLLQFLRSMPSATPPAPNPATR